MAGVRLFGVAVSDINYRVLVAALNTGGTPAELELSERMSGAVTFHAPMTALTPADRDTLLRNLPKPVPTGLAELNRALSSDQRARR